MHAHFAQFTLQMTRVRCVIYGLTSSYMIHFSTSDLPCIVLFHNIRLFMNSFLMSVTYAYYVSVSFPFMNFDKSVERLITKHVYNSINASVHPPNLFTFKIHAFQHELHRL